MKFRLALLAMLVVVAAPMAAQGGGMGRAGGFGRAISVDNLTTLYKLTKDQKTRTQVMVDDYNKSAQPLQQYISSQRNDGAIVPMDSTKKQQQLRDDFNAKFKVLLTGDQSKKFDSVQAAARPVRGGGFR